MRSAIISTVTAPRSPRSCRWMSSSQPWRPAMANRPSSWPLGSWSMPIGSSPPSACAPSRAACSSRSSVPGAIITPVCGKATTCTVTSSRCASAMACRPWKLSSPMSGPTSAWLRTCVVPQASMWRRMRALCSRADRPSCASTCRSLVILSIRLGPAWCGCQGVPQSVLSRCAWPSTRPGSSRQPVASITSAPAGRRSRGRRVDGCDAAVLHQQVAGAGAAPQVHVIEEQGCRHGVAAFP